MAEVGELTWIAEIKEVADAKQEADEMSEDLEDLADIARETDQAMGQVGESTGDAAGSFGDLGSQGGLLSGALGLVAGSVMQLILSLTGLSGAAAAVSGAISTLMGWLGLSGGLAGILSTISAYGSAFVSWLAAGSAGALAFAAAIGAVIGLFGVWILKITGVLDWVGQLGAALADSLPGWANDAILALISIFAGGLAVLGGVILGFMEGGLSGAIARGKEVLMIFADAWKGLGKTIMSGAADLTNGLIEWAGNLVSSVSKGLTGAFDGFMNGMDNTWQAALDLKDDMLQWASGLAGDIADTVAGAFTGAWNAVVPDSLNVPEISIGGQEIGTTIGGKHIGGELPEVSVGGQSLDLPQMQTGGLVEESGAVELHDDEMVLPADISRGVIDVLRGATASQSGSAAGGGGSGVTIEEVSIEIGDQSLDIRELDKFTLQTLAELLGDEMGNELQRLI